MNFHGKVRVAYVAVNSILIMLGYLMMAGFDKSLMTDQELVTQGVSVYVWPVFSLFMTGLVVAGVYAFRGLWLLRAWAVYRVQQRPDQIAVHATSVHDEVLKVKEQASSVPRKL